MFNNDSAVYEHVKSLVFVAPDATRKKQLTVVSLIVEPTYTTNNEKQFIIIPVPYANSTNSVRFVNLNKYTHIFDDLERVFDPNYPYIQTPWTEDNKPIVETFKSKLCKTIEELRNLDKLEFGSVAETHFQTLQKKYPHCGFVVLKINTTLTTAVQYNPFAYIHDIPARDQLFVPCLSNCDLTLYSYNTSSKHNNCKIYHNHNFKTPNVSPTSGSPTSGVLIDASKLRSFDFGTIQTTNKLTKLKVTTTVMMIDVIKTY